MKIVFPDNVFTNLFHQLLPEHLRDSVKYARASEISTGLDKGEFDLALIPSCDLIKHPDFFVSKKFAISFDGIISNVYIYFAPNQVNIEELYFTGDISTNEVILSKILFKERYASDVKINLSEKYNPSKNVLIAGNGNYDDNKFRNGLSFSDELSTMLFLPYVNFIIASKNKNAVIEFNESVEQLDEMLQERFSNSKVNKGLSANTSDYFIENIDSVYFEMTENEIDGLNELIRLPYYHGITDELVEIKFVE